MVIFLVNRNFDYFWLSNIFHFLDKKKIKFEFWYIHKSIYKNNSKSYLDPSNIKYKNFKKLNIKKIKDSHNFVQAVLKTHFTKIISLDPLDECNEFNNSEFLKKIKNKIIILIRSYDFFFKFDQYMSFSKYSPILCGISNYKTTLGYKFLKKVKNLDFLKELKINQIKNIGYFSNKIFTSDKKRNYIIYLPYYSALNTYDKKFKEYAYTIAFYEWFNNKNERHLLKKILKTFVYFFKICSSLKAINIFLFYNEKEILKSLYFFAKKNNLKLIIKTRKKNRVLDYYRSYSDQIIEDDHSIQNPNYLQKLLPQAKLVVGYSSETLVESILNNVPFININNLSFTISKTGNNIFFYKTSKYSEYNYEKLIYNFSIYEFINKLKLKNLDYFKFSKINKNKYLIKYLNYNTSKTLKKIFNLIKKNM